MYSRGSGQSDTSTHCTKCAIMKVAIRTFDVDVVIISIGHVHDFHIEKLWIRFAVGNHNCHIPVHAVANSLLAERSKAMMIFHAIRGVILCPAFSAKERSPFGLHGLFSLLSSVTPSHRSQKKLIKEHD